MKKLTLALLFIMSNGLLFANHWTPEGDEFEDNMTLTGVIQFNGVEQQSASLEVGVFCGEQCRGSEITMFFEPAQRYVIMLTVFGKTGNDFTFKLFDHATGQELNYDSPEAVSFNANGYGTLNEPFVLNFTSSISSFTFLGSETDHNWSTPSNWQENMVPQSGSEVIINGLCNLDQDATVNTLTINEDCSLTIQSGKKLTATDVVSDDASCLIINDGGQLFTQTEETVFATVKKDIAAYTGANDNYYFVAPAAYTASKFRIKTNTTNMLSGEYDLYWFDQISPMEEWQNYEAEDFTYLSMKQGYLYANSANTTLNFAGKLITSDAEEVELDFDDEESVFSGFTLIGNPFPCNATVSGEDLVENAFYVMNEAGGRKNVIVAMNPIVAPCTGLFAVAANEDGVVTFTPSTSNANVRGGESFIKMESYDSENLLEDRVYVKIGTGNGLRKFTLDGHATQMFAAKDGSNYSVIPSNGVFEMPISFTTEEYGWHKISVSTENLSCDYLHLVDNLTGADVDLLATPSYSFEVKASDYASRFKLMFNVTGVEENAASTSSVPNFAYICNGELIISNEGNATLQVIDMMGRIVSSDEINGECRISTEDLTAGLYILNLNGITQKIVVK